MCAWRTATIKDQRDSQHRDTFGETPGGRAHRERKKTTFNVSLRRTYFDILAQPLIKYAARQEEDDTNYGGGYYFYDINAKFTHKFSDRDRLYLSIYTGDDAMHTKMRTKSTNSSTYESKEWQKMNWGGWGGNLVTSLRWSRVVGSKLFMNTTAAFTRYRSDLKWATKINTWINPWRPPIKRVNRKRLWNTIRVSTIGRLRLTLIIRPARRTISSSAQTTRITRFHPMCRR